MLLAPLAYLAFQSLWRGGHLSLDAYSRALEPRVWPLLLRTALLAAAATLSALCLGGAAGAVFERRKFPFRGFLRVASLGPLVLPPFFHVAVWEGLALPGGPLLALFPLAAEAGKPFPIRNELFVIVILGVSFSPVFFFFVSEGLRAIPRELIDAARITRGPWAVRLRVMLPLAMPSVAAGAGIVFTLTLLDYEVPRLLDVATYPILIHVSYGALDDPGQAFAAALPLFALSAALLVATESWADRRGFALTGREGREVLEADFAPGWRAWIVAGGWWAVTVLLPLGGIVWLAGRPSVVAQAWLTDWEKIGWGTAITLCAAVLASLIAGTLLLPALEERRLRLTHLWLPLALPGSLLGFAFIRIFQHGPLFAVYDSPVILVLASTARFVPLALFALRAHLRSVPRDEWDASNLVPGLLARWLKVRIPLALPGLAAGAVGFCLVAANELPATLLLAPPGGEPVIVRIYNLLHYSPERDAMAALCLFHAAGVMLVTALLLAASRVCGCARGRSRHRRFLFFVRGIRRSSP